MSRHLKCRRALANVWERALLVKCLLWEAWGCDFRSQNPLYKPGFAAVCTAGLGMGWKREESLQLIGQPRYTALWARRLLGAFHGRLCLGQVRWFCSYAQPRVCVCAGEMEVDRKWDVLRMWAPASRNKGKEQLGEDPHTYLCHAYHAVSRTDTNKYIDHTSTPQ